MRVLFVGGFKDGVREDLLPDATIYGELGETYLVRRLAAPTPKDGLGAFAYPEAWPYGAAVERLLESYLVFPALYARLLELRSQEPNETRRALYAELVKLAEGVR